MCWYTKYIGNILLTLISVINNIEFMTGVTGHGMCYPVCGMVHVKEPLLLIGKSGPHSGGSGFPLSLSE